MKVDIILSALVTLAIAAPVPNPEPKGFKPLGACGWQSAGKRSDASVENIECKREEVEARSPEPKGFKPVGPCGWGSAKRSDGSIENVEC